MQCLGAYRISMGQLLHTERHSGTRKVFPIQGVPAGDSCHAGRNWQGHTLETQG